MINFFKRVRYLKSNGLTLQDSIETAWIVTKALHKTKKTIREAGNHG